MPLYTFKCPACGHTCDVALTIDERDSVPMACGRAECWNRGVPMERVPTAASFKVEGYNAKNGYTK